MLSFVKYFVLVNKRLVILHLIFSRGLVLVRVIITQRFNMFLNSRLSAGSLIIRQYPGKNQPHSLAQLRDKAET